ncbi:MAG TPA: hypothetical protein VIG08_16895 [Gemmatimonadales bacterium]
MLDTVHPYQDASSDAVGLGEMAGNPPASDARAQLAEVKDRVVEHARTSIRQARDSAASSLTDSRRQAADQIAGVASALKRTSEHLRSDNRGSIASLTESLSQHADQASSYIRDSNLAKMRQDAEQLARRRPGAVLGATFAVGLLLARFLRSSQGRPAGPGGRNA